MCLKKTLLTTLCILAALAGSSPAQTSDWGGMSFVGDHNDWDAKPNMQLTDDYFWEGDFYVYFAPTNRFKFVADWGWNVSEWGISNQVNQEVPLNDVAILFNAANGWGSDIRFTNFVSGIYHVTFDESTYNFTVALVQEIHAQYSRVGVAGEMNSWSTTPNMTLVSNNVWMADLYVGAAGQSRFKIVAEDNWDLSFGEVNQSDFSVPMTATAEGPGGSIYDISMHNVSNGFYRFWFNDTSRVYSVSYLSAGVANYAGMAVVGSFNNWNPIPNMTLISNNLWQAAITLLDQGSITFKFVANGWWDHTWGLSNQFVDPFTPEADRLPILGTSDVVKTEGSDITLTGPPNGTYLFKFNDKTRYFEVIPDGSIVQTFNGWSFIYGYGNYEIDGWGISSGLVHKINSRYGLSVRLKDGSDPHWFRTPYLINGAQEFSFWYRNYHESESATYDVQLSYDNVDWTNQVTFVSDQHTYQRLVLPLNVTTGCYLRIRRFSGSDQLMIEDVMIIEPFGRATIADVGIIPEFPWKDDPVNAFCYVNTNTLATNLAVSMRYRVGSTGAFSSIVMSGTATGGYNTVSAIPAMPPGTLVYYYIQADFQGRGNLAPMFWPSLGSNGPALYGIPRCRPGAVWINEVNTDGDAYDYWETNEYAELAGYAQSDIGNWTLEFYDGAYIRYASYEIPYNTIIPNDGAGFGYFVIGNSNTPNVNIPFTHADTGEGYLKLDGAVRLLDELGIQQFALSYGTATNMMGFNWIGEDLWDFEHRSLSAYGIGSNYTEMSWWTPTNQVTPGEMNYMQFLSGGPTNDLPVLYDAPVMTMTGRHPMVVNVVSTNGWYQQPFYTAKMTNNCTWTPITTYQSSYASGINTITFETPEGLTNFFISIKSTRSW